MREIIFDTETTGLDSRTDRIIEIGGVELFNHFPTGRTFHMYVNPAGQKVHPDALAVHGITDEFLADKPPFADVAGPMLEFFGDAKWIAHNANFDMGFINAELARLGMPSILPEMVIDTLSLARRKNPMGPNSLDALCRRYGIDNTHRTKHGALLDSELLAEVYIEMIGGRQTALGLSSDKGGQSGSDNRMENDDVVVAVLARPSPLPDRVSDLEREAHRALLAKLGEKSIWLKYGSA
ncbi:MULTISPECIES: DNA polymerase III subunit epsilon [unclassified Rhizobium]|uniref:DNA polymerase III subunit epsilon n=1 Tax=unclassified Rhizobium TaxID=2613769 RepID=UPI001ADA02E0|nr:MULTISPECIES: DNA polymerase III subunit epsilon [unclassified Rhizobium]MBO9100407.1 DNA polymerase III subunit epsilon [Rhizobium sp. L58/93]MBO9135453.1 DNA polymerase III subunit epsilon [Rhizobium sp. B209b/85]MBO9170343.1 DNA polymerase III subunit epsilon [Rhizobium sp. L245/93]MBO9186300.1 DNA polymerase III subunit epsilon [Rhizobium sp. E27B/91]QXZ83212.1 DNA polymerase III subunit epsilon [Rhizobium sp. K1/93]